MSATLKIFSLPGLSLLSLKPLLLEIDYEWEDRLIYSHWSDRVSIRSQDHRLGHEGMLFNMVEDPGQLKDISANELEIRDYLLSEVEKWRKEVLPGLNINKSALIVNLH